MGGHKLCFYHCKKKKATCTSLVVSFPLTYYTSRPTSLLKTLHSLPPQSLPESWTIAAKQALTIVKLRVLNMTGVPRVDVVIIVSVQHDLTWGLSVLNIVLDHSLNPSLHNIIPTLMTMSALLSLSFRQLIASWFVQKILNWSSCNSGSIVLSHSMVNQVCFSQCLLYVHRHGCVLFTWNCTACFISIGACHTAFVYYLWSVSSSRRAWTTFNRRDVEPIQNENSKIAIMF